MTIDDVLTYYGTATNMQRVCRMSHSNIQNWRKRGYIPIDSQIKLERLTEGELKASLDHVER